MFSILQPDMYMDVLIPMVVGMPISQGKPVVLVGEGRRRHSFVAMQDVAAFAVAMLDDLAAANQTVAIGGPTPVSWRDIVGAFEHETGRPTSIETIAPGERIPGLPDVVNDTMTAMETYHSPLDMRETAATYGVESTSLQAWVHQSLAQGPIHAAPS